MDPLTAQGLALWGVDLEGIDALERAWKEISGAQILDPRVSSLILRAFLGRTSDRAKKKIEEYFISKGFSPDLRFNQIAGIRLALISADIETGQPVIYGQNPTDLILEGLLASVALPPWFAPIQKEGQVMIDGGALSSLPIEPAIQMGATEIIALDLNDSSSIPREDLTFFQYFEKYIFAVNRRQTSLEMALAEAQGIPVRYINFRGFAAVPTWDFSNNEVLVRAGYERTRLKIDEWSRETRPEFVFPVPNVEELSV